MVLMVSYIHKRYKYLLEHQGFGKGYKFVLVLVRETKASCQFFDMTPFVSLTSTSTNLNKSTNHTYIHILIRTPS